jgi:DNA-directed RNA polymerase specialized sigma24 family protein
MDGFVYTICYHCWSNFLRKHKKHWQSANIDDMYNLRDEHDLQSEVENIIFIEKMKNEIADLSNTHRDIITMTYYDGKSSAPLFAGI